MQLLALAACKATLLPTDNQKEFALNAKNLALHVKGHLLTALPATVRLTPAKTGNAKIIVTFGSNSLLLEHPLPSSPTSIASLKDS